MLFDGYMENTVLFTSYLFNPNWGTFHPLSFCIRFCQMNFYQKNSNFFEVKIDINWVNLTTCQAHSLKIIPLGGVKDEQFFLLS